jgi:hypothetical protein
MIISNGKRFDTGMADLPKLPDGDAYGIPLIWQASEWRPRDTASSFNIYVSASSGEDVPENGYDAEHPVKTLQYAINRSLFFPGTPVRIKLAAGTYPQKISIVASTQGATFHIEGDAAQPDTVVIGGGSANSADVFLINGAFVRLIGVTVKGFTPGTTGDPGVVVVCRGAHVQLENSVIDNTAMSASNYNGIYVYQGASCSISNVMIKGAFTYGFRANQSGTICIRGGVTTAGAGTYSQVLVSASSNGRISLTEALSASGTLSGGKRYFVTTNGDISGSSNIPTSNLAAGTVATGGRVN